jgi:NitT/TauT family transport system substrate-binding protein
MPNVLSGTRRALLGALTLALPGAAATLAARRASAAAPAPGARLPRLTLAGPPGTVSAPLLHMVETGALASFAERVEFVAWRDPDQLRVLALDGKADVLAMPTNVAANLHNRGAPVTLLNVSTWGALWMVSRATDRRTLADFRGQEVAIPFRADMPDIVFQTLVAKDGLDPRKDFRLRYVPTPLEAMQLLITRRVDHALLAEPADQPAGGHIEREDADAAQRNDEPREGNGRPLIARSQRHDRYHRALPNSEQERRDVHRETK